MPITDSDAKAWFKLSDIPYVNLTTALSDKTS
jgi:hypothetical protein